MGESKGCFCSAFCLLQFLPNTFLDPLYSGDGSGYNQKRMDACRSTYELARESTVIIVHASARMILCLMLLELAVVMLGVCYLFFELIYTIVMKTFRLL